MALRVVIGIDGGGTKTLCAVAGEDGVELGRATGGPSNYQTVGVDGTRAVLESVIAGAIGAVGQAVEVTGLCLALAGADRPADAVTLRGIVASLLASPPPGLRWRLTVDRAVLVNDAIAALTGGTGRRQGVVVIAGTGSIALGVNASGERRRAGGWGHLLGDEGSGYQIGAAGLRAVCRQADGRGPATSITPLLLAAHRLGAPADLIELAYGQWGVPDIAAVAQLVLRAASDGDAVAGEIVGGAAQELALAASTVITALNMQQESFDVVLAGGLWPGSAALVAGFRRHLAAVASGATAIFPRAEPVAGALLLAREAAGTVTLE